MQGNDRNTVARQNLDARLLKNGWADRLQRPPRGWIKAIREALGITTAQLAHRMGVSQPSVVSMEQSESRDHIKIETLRRAASALDCQLVYALVPNQSLETMVQSRRRALAEQYLAAVEQSMRLENQSVEETVTREHQLKVMAAEIDPRTLWNV